MASRGTTIGRHDSSGCRRGSRFVPRAGYFITGGTDKNLDFEPVRNSYSKAKISILLAGTGTDKLMPLLKQDGLPFSGPFDELSLAVKEAIARAMPGDTVILSPGCASFGMFVNEFDRGRKFKETVRNLLE